MTEIVRTHDTFYLDENRYEKPKRMFLEIIEGIEAVYPGTRGAVIADFGCAAGEFAYALRKRFPTATVEGYDLLEELVSKARARVPGAAFQVGSVLDPDLCDGAHADFTLCVGVLSIFDQFEPLIANLLHWTKPGGHVFLQGLFNAHPVDVNIKYNLSADYNTSRREAGWNLFSKESVSQWLRTRADIENFAFKTFEIDVDLPPVADPVRSWTIQADGKRLIINGLCLLQPHSILHLQKR